MNGSFVLYTNQAAAHQETISAVGEIVVGNWYQVVATRDGDTVLLYNNGLDVTDTVGTHTDPVAAVRELHIGIYDNETGSPFDGQMWLPRIWNGHVLTPTEIREMFETERQLFQV